jgi:hypothetical protein
LTAITEATAFDDLTAITVAIAAPLSSVAGPQQPTALDNDPTAAPSSTILDDPTAPSSTVAGAQRPTTLDDPTAPSSTVTTAGATEEASICASEASVDPPLHLTTSSGATKASVEPLLCSTASRPTNLVVAFLLSFITIMSGLQPPVSLAAQAAADAQAIAKAATATQTAAQAAAATQAAAAAQAAASTISTADFMKFLQAYKAPTKIATID